ncbi:hypothetical protein LTR12_004315 [Friedmanniomyces endolithicus]|nr:hypothetical protein LTR74_005842 [Friedmanniomyces endolithicus]KAK1821257.1 hypothetical protein LTR12_004315 [Friedmanniomyces endolithicus]
MLLYVTCCFLSFSASRPLPDKAGWTVRQALAELFDTLMDPAVLYTDPSTEFTSREMREEMEGRGVYLAHALAVAYRPTGAIENANRILRRCLEKQLPLTHTPIQLPTSDLAQACFEAQGERTRDRHHARQLKHSVQEKREQLYNSSIKAPPIRDGDIVFSQVETLGKFKSIDPRWAGPYRVVAIKGDHDKAAELELLKEVGKQHSRRIVRHLGMLRVFIPRLRRLRPEGDGDDVDWKKLVRGDRT